MVVLEVTATPAEVELAATIVYGLLRSSLIMGVHPGCPLCSIVAASFVAVETDVEETISATKVSGLWSVRVVALLSAGPSSCFCIHQLLFPCLEVLVQSASPHHAVSCKVLPRFGVDVKCFHVSLANILVAQLWAAFGSPSRCQLCIENVFWDAAILQAVDMPQTTQPVLSEQGEHAWKVSSGQALDTLTCQDMPRIRRMLLRWKELSLFSCLAYVVHVSLPYISVLTTQALYTTILVFPVSLGLVHISEVRRASVAAAFPILLSVSMFKERLSVMVEPRYVNCSTISSS